ncbi:MAG: hypothetical protein HYW14_04545 [Planctomycetes bacterium]|nr:hypothetical protein [Planctomycetota bacterium]
MTLLIVWEQIHTTKYSYEVAKLQKKITDLQEKNRRLECQVNALKKPERVVNAIQSMGIDLAQPLENKDMIAKTKQPGPQRGRATKTVVASARAELGPLGRGKEVKKQKGGKVKR